MPSACTKRPRNDDDPHLSPDDNDLPSPPKRSRAQWTKDKKYESGKGMNDDADDETSTEPTSSSGSDSSVDSSDEDDEENSDNEEQEKEKGTDGKEETVPSLSARQKPRIHRIERNSDILSRITAFLPQMKNANESLQRELAAGRANEIQLDQNDGGEGEGEGEDEESKGRYIEMNLGLGVLEEKHPGDESDDSDDSDDEQQKQPPKTHELPNRPKDSRVLGKLMGVKEDESKKPTIEVMRE